MISFYSLVLFSSTTAIGVFITALNFKPYNHHPLLSHHPSHLFFAVLLIYHSLSSTVSSTPLLQNMELTSRYFRRGTTVGINIGGLAAGIYVLHRNKSAFVPCADDDDVGKDGRKAGSGRRGGRKKNREDLDQKTDDKSTVEANPSLENVS